MRTIPAATQAVLSDPSVWATVLLRLDFPSGVVGFHAGTGTYTFGGLDYVGAGKLGGISEAKETDGMRSSGIVATLSGLDSTLLTDVQTGNYRGRDADMYYMFFDERTMQPLSDPANVWSGFMDDFEYLEEAGRSDLILKCEHRGRRFPFSRARRRCDEDHVERQPGDRFYEFLPQVGRPLTWGGRQPVGGPFLRGSLSGGRRPGSGADNPTQRSMP